MHFYSFDIGDPIYDLGWVQLSFQLITLENVFGLDPARVTIQATDATWQLTCTQLRWAGQQQTAPGHVTIAIDRAQDQRLRIRVDAEAPHPIRAAKIIVRDLPAITPLDERDRPRPVPEDGRIERYPNERRLPLLYAGREDGGPLAVRCEDPQARAKRFAVYRERMGPLQGRYALECIHEADARHFAPTMAVPGWIIATGISVDAFRDEQLAFNETALGVRPWVQRRDLPGWAHDIRLVLTLHGMHWSGYVFNTYEDMLHAIGFVCQHIAGRHVLAYLPGWEGRYYWQYGDFRPEPRLGGAEGFARLCSEAATLDVHVMPMFGGNCANAWAGNFHRFGPSSHMKSATRNRFHGNQPDWDLARAHDTGWQAWLNPGAPAWQHELVSQIDTLIEQFGFDAVFLDTVEVWTNDPDFNIRDGYRQLVGRLRQQHPDLLVTGEDWWDGLLAIFPMFQRSGPWRDVPEWVGRYARLFGHICEGDPSRGSTGVFEAGYAPYAPLPDAETYIPTLAFVDGTLAQAKAEIARVATQAAAYA